MLEFDHRVRRCRVETDLGASSGLGCVAPRSLQQVIMNLVLNAASDAVADRPGPVVAIRSSRHEGRCMIEVTDNGVGIPAEMLEEIFEPFSTPPSRSVRGPGWGCRSARA